MNNEEKVNLLIDKFLELKQLAQSLLEKNKDERSHLQNYLYFAAFPIFSFGESVAVLYGKGKFHAAGVLLRSLVEAHINIIYHQVGDAEHKLALSARTGFDQKLVVIREIKSLIKKYPELESKDTNKLFNRDYLASSEKWVVDMREAIIYGNKLQREDNDIGLQQKAMDCDKNQKQIKGAKPGHFEHMYTIQYRYLSPYTHLDIEGLNMFVTKEDDGYYILVMEIMEYSI